MASNIFHPHHFQPLLYTYQSYPIPLQSSSIHIHNNSSPKKYFTIKSSNNSSPPQSQPEPELEADDDFPASPDDDFPAPPLYTQTYPIEKRRRSEIIRDRKSSGGLVKAEPPNFEIGWKRTKPIPLEKPTGYVIMDILEKLEELIAKKQFGSTELLAKVGEIVSERAREEAEVLREEGKVEERMVRELFRVLKLMEMDLAMVKAAVKDDTLTERLQQAKARCRQAILVANSF